jgi:hypothetical protein
MNKRFMVLLHTSFLKEENHTDKTLNLSLQVSFQLVHPSLDDQGNPFMGCDCHIELVFRGWKSGVHVATITTTTKHSTLCYLYGRMLLILLTSALGSPLRVTLWQQQREVSLLKLVRHFQASAEQWLQVLFQSIAQLTWFLSRACVAATRLVTKDLRQRRTSAQRVRESLGTRVDFSSQYWHLQPN